MVISRSDKVQFQRMDQLVANVRRLDRGRRRRRCFGAFQGHGDSFGPARGQVRDDCIPGPY